MSSIGSSYGDGEYEEKDVEYADPIGEDQSRSMTYDGARYEKKDGKPEFSGKQTQWSTYDNEMFYGVGKTCNALPPALYGLQMVNGIGLTFNNIPFDTNNLLKFPDTVMTDVVDEISSFWNKNTRFKKYGIPHRRGILLYGPAGSGKSCTTQLICDDVIKRGGIILIYTPDLILNGLSVLRAIQPVTPVVVLMEDLDAIMSNGSTTLLNMLDGVYSKAIDRVVYLATTNFPERLERRVTNRPSRFDRVVEVKLPSVAARKMYLEFLSKDKENIILNKPSKDHDHFSFAHLKELFTSVVVFENNYDVVLKRLREMVEKELPDGREIEFAHKGRLGLSGKVERQGQT